MKVIKFATGNQRKIAEANAACKDFDIVVEPVKVEIDEIQHHDPLEIAKHKARAAQQAVGEPVVVTDASWAIPGLNGFPGGYMSDVESWFNADDFIALMSDKSNRAISYTENIIYCNGENVKVFSETYEGVVVDSPRGVGNSIETVAEFDGKTISERREEGGFTHNPDDYVWDQFAQWFRGEASTG